MSSVRERGRLTRCVSSVITPPESKAQHGRGGAVRFITANLTKSRDFCDAPDLIAPVRFVVRSEKDNANHFLSWRCGAGNVYDSYRRQGRKRVEKGVVIFTTHTGRSGTSNLSLLD